MYGICSKVTIKTRERQHLFSALCPRVQSSYFPEFPKFSEIIFKDIQSLPSYTNVHRAATGYNALNPVNTLNLLLYDVTWHSVNIRMPSLCSLS